MKIIHKEKSKSSNAIKFVFLSDDKLAMESTYINKNDGKDIICLPSQTACNMGCKFCHITDISNSIINRNITKDEIVEMVKLINNEIKFESKTLLISFMGCGEPLLNYKHLIEACVNLSHLYKNIRFALATSMPKKYSHVIEDIATSVLSQGLDLKIHLSLHYTDNITKKEWMPTSCSVEESIFLLNQYKKLTGSKTEIHYTLIEGVNDTEKDINELCYLLKDYPYHNVKFLHFNEKDNLDYHKSSIDTYNRFSKKLEECGITSEYYTPPALDIGGSCGQLLKEFYLKYNTK